MRRADNKLMKTTLKSRYFKENFDFLLGRMRARLGEPCNTRLEEDILY